VRLALIIPAAGAGRRLAMRAPKALVEIAGRPLFRHALDCFDRTSELIEAVVVIPAACRGEFVDASAESGPARIPIRFVDGAETRQQSVALGLRALESGSDLICVHDAARPLVSAATISAVILAAQRTGAATAGRRPVDSVRFGLGADDTRSVDRSTVWLVETPQVFERGLFEEAHAIASMRGLSATDDAALVEAATGRSVTVVESDGVNPKITTPADLEWVGERIRSARQA
jgi:2-C-methyl-D-erythritol 4-phosphate cytidylyltransferase